VRGMPGLLEAAARIPAPSQGIWLREHCPPTSAHLQATRARPQAAPATAPVTWAGAGHLGISGGIGFGDSAVACVSRSGAAGEDEGRAPHAAERSRPRRATRAAVPRAQLHRAGGAVAVAAGMGHAARARPCVGRPSPSADPEAFAGRSSEAEALLSLRGAPV